MQRAMVMILIGLPASGKSTFKAGLESDATICCPDDHLLDVATGKYVWTPERSSRAWAQAYQRFGAALARGARNIIWDATFLSPISRSAILHTAKGHGYEVDAVFFNTPVGVCKARNARRSPDRMVPSEKMDLFASQLVPPTKDEGFDGITVCGSSARE